MDLALPRRHEKIGLDSENSNDEQMNEDEQAGLPAGQYETDKHQSQLGPAEEHTPVNGSTLMQGIARDSLI